MASAPSFIRRISLAAILGCCLTFAMSRVGIAAPDRTLGMALMGAEIDIDGTPLHGTGVKSVSCSGGAFDRSTAGCLVTATPFFEDVVAFVQNDGGLPGGVAVFTDSRATGDRIASRFTVMVYCAQ